MHLEHDGNALLAGQRHRAWDGWNRGYGHWNRDVCTGKLHLKCAGSIVPPYYFMVLWGKLVSSILDHGNNLPIILIGQGGNNLFRGP